MRLRDLLTDDEYLKEKAELQTQINKLREQLRDTEDRTDKWIDLTERVFNFATLAREAFQSGNLQTKKEILNAIGQNPILKDGKLSIQANIWLQPIKEAYPVLEAEYLRLEPMKTTINKGQNEAFDLVRSALRRDRDSNPRDP